ncbi:MAG: tetratricopeptide repeat protein [Pirellulales bacterium]|nr:tetratricopeptide repeat protein [Pirellulales bacterium]
MFADRIGNTIGIPGCCVLCLSIAWALLSKPAHAEAGSSEADTIYASAEDSYQAAEWQLAVRQFDTFGELHPDDPRAVAAQFYAAEAQMQNGQYSDAHARYRRLLQGPSSKDKESRIRFRAGEAAILAGSIETAQADLQAFLEHDPNDPLVPTAVLLLGKAYQSRGDYDAALAAYHRIIGQYSTDPQMPVALFAAAGLHGYMKQHVEAQQLYERLIAEHADYPQIEEAVFQLGLLFELTGNTSQAAEQWMRIHAEFPASRRWPEATYRLAQASFERGDFSTADTLVHRWLETDHSSGSSREMEPNRPDEDAIFRRVLYLKARIAAASELWDQVAEPLEQLITQFPDSPMRLPAQFWIAEANFRNGRHATALKQLEQLALLVTGRNESWVAMVPLRSAQILARQGAWDKAYRMAQSIGEDYPDFELLYEADYVIGRCLANYGEMAQARQAYRRVIQSSTGASTETAAMAQWMIGETYMHQKDYRNALTEYMRTLNYAEYPVWRARAALQVGVCHERMHQWDKAARWYQSVAKEYAQTEVGSQLAIRQEIALARAGGQRWKTSP